MKARGAIAWAACEPWSVEDVDLEEPGVGTVLVRMKAAAVCRRDQYACDVGDGAFPMLGGHEGAGIVAAVGPGVGRVAVGDHVVLTAPSCGDCPNCQRGLPNLCLTPPRVGGASVRGTRVSAMSGLGTFATHAVVPASAVVPVDPTIPFEVAALLGCTVATGWGAAVRTAGVRAGDDVLVVGLGGVGMSAMLAAVSAGARLVIGVDPVDAKRSRAMELGATHVFADAAAAMGEIAHLTAGLMAKRVIVAVGHARGADVDTWMGLTSKAGACVLPALGDPSDDAVTLNLAINVLMGKRLEGSLHGGADPRHDVALLASLYRAGRLTVDAMVSRCYGLDEIAGAFRDMLAGNLIRGVVRFDD